MEKGGGLSVLSDGVAGNQSLFLMGPDLRKASLPHG